MFAQHHHDALELEVQVLSKLLQRNQCSHRRSKPFQHASLALRCLLRRGGSTAGGAGRGRPRGTLSSSSSSSKHHEEGLRAVRLPYLQLFESSQTLLRQAEDAVNRRRVKRKRQEVFWELSSSTQVKSQEHDEVHDLKRQHETIIEALNVLDLQELFSRIDTAASYVFSEIARGFFLPFMTVAVASLARIRTLIIQLFQHVIDVVIPQSTGYLRELGIDEGATKNDSQRSVDAIRAFLSLQANIANPLESNASTAGATDTEASAQGASTNRKERKSLREDARRRQFLRDLGLPARMADPVADDNENASSRSENMDAATRLEDDGDADTGTSNRHNSNVRVDDDDTDSVLDGALSGTRADRGGTSGVNVGASVDDDDGDDDFSSLTRKVPRRESKSVRPPEDRGESVAVVAPAAATADRTADGTGRSTTTRPVHRRDDGTLDKNLAWAERLGQEKRSKKKKDKKRKPKRDSDASPPRPTGTKSAKKSKSGDFFDDLFG